MWQTDIFSYYCKFCVNINHLNTLCCSVCVCVYQTGVSHEEETDRDAERPLQAEDDAGDRDTPYQSTHIL